MRKHKDAPKIIGQSIGLTPIHIAMLDNFIVSKGHTNYSDTVRRAIEFFHDKTFPDYVYKETEAEKIKREARETKEAMEAIPAEQFAIETLKANIEADGNGTKYAVIHVFGNSIGAFPLSEIKEWAATHQSDVELHLNKLKEMPLEDQYSGYMSDLFKRDYGITLPVKT